MMVFIHPSGVTQGALREIAGGNKIEEPVLQCLQTKRLETTTGNAERFRLVFGDVDNFMQGMLGSQMNHLITSDKLVKGSFVRLKSYQTNEIKGKHILVVLDCEVLEQLGIKEKLGTPVAIDERATAETDNKTNGSAIPGNNFYGNKPQQPAQQQNNLPTRSNGAGSHAHGQICPIEAISPYAHKWTMKARCTHKSEIKTWHNKNGEGKLFSVNFLDDSGEIKATAFREQVDQFYDLFQEGQVYFVSSPCRVQLAKKQFTNVANDYELTFERDTIVEKAEDQDGAPRVRYNFIGVGDLLNVEKDAVIDTIGILRDVGEVSQIVSKTTSKPYDKRELTVVDNSGYSVRITIWGNSATTFDVTPESVVAFKGAKVSDFGGRTLSLLSSGSMSVDPDIDEAHRLKGWYDTQGRSDTFATHASVMGSVESGGKRDTYKTIEAVMNEELGMNPEKTDYFTVKGTVIYVKKESIAYPACQSEGCNKKVIEQEPGQWRCERCDKTWDRPEWRYILTISLADHTGQLWLSCFDDVGRMVIGASANEMMELRDDPSTEAVFNEKVAAANCQSWVFRCRAKLDTFQDQQRVRYQVSSANPINFSQECNRLADILKQYNMEADNGLFVT